MPAYDASIWDRVAELESRLASAEKELAYTRKRWAEGQTAILTRPAITAETDGEPSYPADAAGEADLPVITLDVHELGAPAPWDERTEKPEITAASREWYPPGTDVDIAFDGVRWRVIPLADSGEVRRCCLAEDHPGCGEVFDLKLGTWNPATHKWDYEAEASAKGIDWWYSVSGPYPDEGATGNFEPRPSDEYGTIWHVLGNLSCDPDNCGECGGEA